MQTNPTHIIKGTQNSTGKVFYVAIRYALSGRPSTYYKVPHPQFATAMPQTTAAVHRHKLEHDYPGNTYTTVPATFTIPRNVPKKGGRA